MWGKINLKVVNGKPTHAAINKSIPKVTYSVEDSTDAVKPFNLVYVNTAHATQKNAYVINADDGFGDSNSSEGDLLIVEPRLIRSEATELMDINTPIDTGKTVECSPIIPGEFYWVRPSSLNNTSFSIGTKLKVADNGTVAALEASPTNPSTVFGHVFVAMENVTFTTTGVKTLLLVKYMGLAPYKIAGG